MPAKEGNLKKGKFRGREKDLEVYIGWEGKSCTERGKRGIETKEMSEVIKRTYTRKNRGGEEDREGEREKEAKERADDVEQE